MDIVTKMSTIQKKKGPQSHTNVITHFTDP